MEISTTSKSADASSQTRESIATTIYKHLIRPGLFRFSDPEKAHEFAGKFLRWNYPAKLMGPYSHIGADKLSFVLGDKVCLRGPIGLAAGFDKNATMLPGLSYLFDYITAGTMIPYSWPGNPKRRVLIPYKVIDETTRRVVRLEEENGMLNCLGFPFDGPREVVPRIEKYTGIAPINLSVAVRPVKGIDQSEAIEQFRWMLDIIRYLIPNKIQMLEPNFASPNTSGLAIFFEERNFEALATLLTKRRPFNQALLFLKMPPHLNDEDKERNLRIASRWIELGGDGITAINTVKTKDDGLSMGAGGKSGKPIYPIMRANIRDYRSHLGDKVIINAAGGITPDKVPELIMSGDADTVQVLTPFIYEGPGIVRDSKMHLLRALEKEPGYLDIEFLREKRKAQASIERIKRI